MDKAPRTERVDGRDAPLRVASRLGDRQGRRRPWMLLGQGMCALGCLALLAARGMWQLTAAFATFMMGGSISWGAYMCIVPEYMPEFN